MIYIIYILLGVDSFSILFNHRSFQKLAVSPGVLIVFWKEGSPERMGKCPLEYGWLRNPFRATLKRTPLLVAFCGGNHPSRVS